MAFKSLVEQARRRKAHFGTDDKINFSMRGPDKRGYYSLAFSIGPQLVVDAGIIKGDKLDLLWDPEDEIGIIRRDNSAGKNFTLSKTGRGFLTLTWSEGMPRPQDNKKITLSGTETKHGEIIFDLPTHKDKPESE